MAMYKGIKTLGTGINRKTPSFGGPITTNKSAVGTRSMGTYGNVPYGMINYQPAPDGKKPVAKKRK